jgi:hypothetical protein
VADSELSELVALCSVESVRVPERDVWGLGRGWGSLAEFGELMFGG